MTLRRAGHVLAGGIAMLAGAGHAALGGPRAGIEQDRAHFAATMAASAAGVAQVATLQPAGGGTIREYSTADGTVFAVTWRGRARPDLRQLLGDRFDVVSADMARPRGRRLARLMTVQRAEVVVRSQGRPGAFFGLAYDPRLIPAGFAIDDLR